MILSRSAETNALSVQRSLVLGGHGLAILPPIADAEDLKKGRLTGAPLAEPGITRTIVLGLPTNRPTGSHITRAVELLVDQVQGAISAGE